MPLTNDLYLVHGFQSAFLKGGRFEIPKIESARDRIVSVLKKVSGNDKVIMVQDVRSPEDRYWSHDKTSFYVGSRDIAIPEELSDQNIFPVFQSSKPNSFLVNKILIEIKRLDPRRIIIFGCRTHLNVLFTAEAAKQYGYDVLVVEGFCASEQDYHHNLAISLMADCLGIDIVEEL